MQRDAAGELQPGDRQSEQRRLHGLSSWGKRLSAAAHRPRFRWRDTIYRGKSGEVTARRGGIDRRHPLAANRSRYKVNDDRILAAPAKKKFAGGPYQLAGSRFRPRNTKVGRHSGLSASSSRSSGSRRNKVEMAISASIRASWAPRQKWMPPPNESGRTLGRVMSRRSGRSG